MARVLKVTHPGPSIDVALRRYRLANRTMAPMSIANIVGDQKRHYAG